MREVLRQRVDLIAVLTATGQAAELVEHCTAIVEDREHVDRKQRQLCVACHYSRRQGGTRTTKQQCGLCETVQTFGSTATDVLCQRCAAAHRLCKRCGADINLTERRKL